MDKMESACYSSRIEVHLDTIGRNVNKIRKHTGLEVIPVVKSNAYGFGTVGIANYLVHKCGIRMLAVARIFEAMQIVNSGCTESGILILGPVVGEALPIAIQHGFQFPLFRIEDAKIISDEAKKQGLASVKVHLKIETGMHRIGVEPGDELAALVQYARSLGNIEIDGVFTHFATSDEANYGDGNDFTREQFERFKCALQQLKELGVAPRYIHCCNTGGAVWLKEAYPYCTHVRTGSLYLGYSYIQGDWNPLGVEESGAWKTSIVNISEVMPGESAGYGRCFMPDRPSKVAIIAVGYGDGYLRSLATKGCVVLIQGVRCKFVGICMDMGFINVTDVPCAIGDEVTLFGDDGHGNKIPGLEIGHIMGETRCAMFTHITERVARVYIEG